MKQQIQIGAVLDRGEILSFLKYQDHRGGLLDKPGKSRDFYHTCYTLSGLALAQIFASPGLLNTSVLGSFHIEFVWNKL